MENSDYIKDVATFIGILENHKIELNDKDKKEIDDFLSENALLDGRLFNNPFIYIGFIHNDKIAYIDMNVKDIKIIEILFNDINIICSDTKKDVTIKYSSENIAKAVFLFIRFKIHLFEKIKNSN